MSSRCERCRCERFCSNLGRRGSRPPTRPRGVRQERFDPQAFRSGLTTEPGPVDCRLLPRRVPNRVPNFPVLAGLARTDRTVTWTRPLLLGLDSLPRTETGGLLIRRFRVQVPGAYREKPQVRPHIGVAWGFVVSGRNDPVVRLVPQLVVQWLFCDRLFCAGSRWTRWLR
jgi:hypothetical protein